jgi:hypothetical protein
VRSYGLESSSVVGETLRTAIPAPIAAVVDDDTTAAFVDIRVCPFQSGVSDVDSRYPDFDNLEK